ncbi:MerR family transcriptional regulator [Marinomonas epiphytica]
MNTEGLFPIRELSLRTGVNTVTLRAWERRYGLLKPQRTDKGHRLYSEQDIQLVESILYWIQQGVAVSKVRALLQSETSSVPVSEQWVKYQEVLIQAVVDCHIDKVEQLYKQVSSQYPALTYAESWLLPVVERLVGAEKIVCEGLLAQALTKRLGRFVNASAKSNQLLITSCGSEKSFLCLLTAAVLEDQGSATLVMPNLSDLASCLSLLKKVDVTTSVLLCDLLNDKGLEPLLSYLQVSNKHLVLVSPNLWLLVKEKGIVLPEQLHLMAQFNLAEISGVLENCR